MLGACGSAEDAKLENGSFSPCGGALNGSWDFQSATVEGSNCSEAPTVSGFLHFTGQGRVSIQLQAQGLGASCQISSALGGFLASEGSKACLAKTAEGLTASPCPGATPDSDPTSAAFEYCREGDSLQIKSNTLLDPEAEVVFNLAPAP